MARNKQFARALKDNRIDLNADYFELTDNEISIVDKFRRKFRYNGRNSLGRSATRQFYYAAQKGNK